MKVKVTFEFDAANLKLLDTFEGALLPKTHYAEEVIE